MKAVPHHRLFASLLLLGACAVVQGQQLGGNTLTVNSLNDASDGSCDSGHCSLREALEVAAGDGVDTVIMFAAGLTGTIAPTSTLQISAGTQLLGPGPELITISGNNARRVLVIPIGANNVTVAGLTIANGNTSSLPASVNRSGGGLSINGDGVVLSNLRVINNVAPVFSGGINASGSSLSIINSEISDNQSITGGGMGWTGFGDTLLLENVTFSGNQSQQSGAAMRLTTNAGDQVTFRYITVAANTDNMNNGVSISMHQNASATIIASIFADHIGNGDDINIVGAGPVNVLNNVIERTTSMINGSDNRIGVDAVLEPLDFPFAGAATRVFALAPQSPAIDRVVPGQLGCGSDVALDQVGQTRPQLDGCDAGAYETDDAAAMAVDDMTLVFPNTATTLDVTANDFEPAGAIDPGTVQIVTGAANGSLTNLGDGRITYQPAQDFAGPTDSYTYTVTDDDGQTSLPATVTLSFVPVADPTVSMSGPGFVRYNEAAEYTIRVENIGQTEAQDVRVQSMLDSRFQLLEWSCQMVSNGAVCPQNSGNGELDQMVLLPVNGVVVYSLMATIPDVADESEVLAAVTVTPAAGSLEITSSNNQAMVSSSLGLLLDGFE
ncbi:MAG: hypothetical protein Tsb002_13330 [Wenzhouxiangellaceae bacterium]